MYVFWSPHAELNKLIAVLDDRAKKSAAKNSFHRKERVHKSPSLVQPPPDDPKWALKFTQEREDTAGIPPAHTQLVTPTRAPQSEEDSSEFSF